MTTFTPEAQRAYYIGYDEAVDDESFHVTVGHYLLGIVEEDNSYAASIMRELSPKLQDKDGVEVMRQSVIEHSAPLEAVQGHDPEPDIALSRALEKAEQMATFRGASEVSARDVLLEIAMAETVSVQNILDDMEIDRLQLTGAASSITER